MRDTCTYEAYRSETGSGQMAPCGHVTRTAVHGDQRVAEGFSGGEPGGLGSAAVQAR
jgi:hypothetical protein